MKRQEGYYWVLVNCLGEITWQIAYYWPQTESEIWPNGLWQMHGSLIENEDDAFEEIDENRLTHKK